MTLRELHEAYRRCVDAMRDETASPEARETTKVAMIEARRALDEALVAESELRADEAAIGAAEARAAAARLVGSIGPVAQPTGLPIDKIRAYGNSRARGETLSFTVMPFEQRADWTTVDTTTYSTYTVPQEWINDVYKFQIAQSGVLRAGPRILQTATGNQINYPKLNTDMATAAGSEGVAATETNPVFGTVPLNSYRIDGFTPIADELFRDSGVNIEALVRDLAGRSLGAKAAGYYGDVDVGTGSSLPAAITVGTTLGVTAVSTTAPTLDEIKRLLYSLLPEYRMTASFVSNTTLTTEVALMKDDNGQYLWQPSNAEGQPDRLFGRPWHEDPYFDASATGNIPLVCGDVGQAYIVRRIGGIEISFSRDYSFISFETTARWAMWHDAATIDTIACKHLILA